MMVCKTFLFYLSAEEVYKLLFCVNDLVGIEIVPDPKANQDPKAGEVPTHVITKVNVISFISSFSNNI